LEILIIVVNLESRKIPYLCSKPNIIQKQKKQSMKRHKLYLTTLLTLFVALAFMLSSCGSKTNQTTQTDDTPSDQPGGKKAPIENTEISIDPAQDGINLAELFSNRNAYENNTIRIRGQVVKVNTGILGKNWVHIQDGTGDGKDFDLTVTTQDIPEVGDIVTFEGVIALNKDFGSGYTYDVIMEDAVVVKDS
jgi:hypothetical protein